MKYNLITSTDLKKWADTRECQEMLPELIKRLLHTSATQPFTKFRIPSGDEVSLSGWDGIVENQSQIHTIAPGTSLWEMGVDKNVQAKAESDFNKRKDDSLGYEQSQSIFVFVTPRIWEKSDEWVQEKKQLNIWKDIVVYTAVELAVWISMHPTVALWLANSLGKASTKVELPESYWSRFAIGEKYKLNPSIMLGGRDETIKKIKDCVITPQTLHIQSVSRKESLAFIVATVIEQEKHNEDWRYNCILAFNEDDIRQLIEKYDNLVIITDKVGNWEYAIQKGHSIICAVSPEDQIKAPIKLPTIDRDSFVAELEKLGIDSRTARSYAVSTARNILPLKRILDIDVCKPCWTELENIIPAILIGRWNARNEGDRELLEKLAGISYAQYEKILKAVLLQDDSPLIQIDSIWRLYSAYDALFYIQPFLTQDLKNKLEEVVALILTDDDLDIIEKLESGISRSTHYQQRYSRHAKEGVLHTLIILSLLETDNYTHQIISKYFKELSEIRLLSLNHYLPLIAEADPETFLDVFQSDINKGAILCRQLLKTYGNPIWGLQHNLSNLLWALESLAWSEQWIGATTQILLALMKYEIPANLGNTPINSLTTIYRLILPQTYVSFDQRYNVLQYAAKKYPTAVYKVCLQIINNLQEHYLPSTSHFKWRLLGEKELLEGRLYPTIDSVSKLVKLMLSVADYSEDCICELLKLSSHNYMQCTRDMIMSEIESRKENIFGYDNVIANLREMIHQHLSFPEAQWALQENELTRYKNLLDEITPNDIISRTKWFFDKEYYILEKVEPEEYYEKYNNIRKEGVEQVIEVEGFNGLQKLCNTVVNPHLLGETIALLYNENLNNWIINSFVSITIPEDVVIGYYSILASQIEYELFLNNITKIENEDSRVQILSKIVYRKFIADYINTLSKESQLEYWKNVYLGHWKCEDAEKLVKRFNSVGRYDRAMQIIYNWHDGIIVSDDLIMDTILQFTRDVDEKHLPDSHHVKAIITHLDKSSSEYVQKHIISIEFYLYQWIRMDRHFEKLQLISSLAHDPYFMMKFIELGHFPDDEEAKKQKNQLLHENPNLLSAMNQAQTIQRDLNAQPCTDERGEVNEQLLKNYITTLLQLAKEKNMMNATYSMIGQLLANIRFNESYPPDYLCELIEDLNNDYVDSAFSSKLFNKRGVVTRGWNEGGGIEYAEQNKYHTYAEKTRYSYPRITKVFKELAKQYQYMGQQEDIEATLLDLDN